MKKRGNSRAISWEMVNGRLAKQIECMLRLGIRVALYKRDSTSGSESMR